jgi:hypothetical protein
MTEARTWEVNADEFGALSKQGQDLRLGALVACSVFKGKATDKINIPLGKLGKAPASVFADRAGTGAARVLRHLEAWHKLAGEGLVRPTTDCEPSLTNDPSLFLVSVERVAARFDEVFDASTAGSRPRAPISEISAAIVKQPGYVDKLVTEMSDEAFEVLNEAIVNLTAEAPIITETGVRPTPAPSPAKKARVHETGRRLHEAEVGRSVQDAIDNAPPRTMSKPDGQVSPAQEKLRILLAEDELWNTEVVIHWLRKTVDAVTDYPGPLERTNEEFIEERLSVMEELIARIRTAVEAKRTGVPDTVPENWS